MNVLQSSDINFWFIWQVSYQMLIDWTNHELMLVLQKYGDLKPSFGWMRMNWEMNINKIGQTSYAHNFLVNKIIIFMWNREQIGCDQVYYSSKPLLHLMYR